MDLLNLSGDERLDLGDLTYALNTAPPGLVNEVTGSFLVAPGAFSVVTGFRPSASAAQGPVTVGDAGTANVAFLGQRIGAQVTQGVFTTQGPPTQSVSIATFPAGTYGIFVRFNRLTGATQTRKFWSKTAPGQEYAQLAETRLVATWEVRLELTAPSAEWQKIGQAVVTAAGTGQGSTVVVTDQRNLYFEGAAATGYSPSWGVAADRAADRVAANSGNLQRQLDALRACIVDIKGRGLAKWYQPNISGMQIGSGFGLTDTPSANTLAIGDNSYSFSNTNGSLQQSLNGASDYFFYYRPNQFWLRVVNGTTVYANNPDGSTRLGAGSSFGYLSVNASGSQASIAAVNTDSLARLGVFAAQAKDALIAFGTNIGNPRLYLRATWTGTPTATFTLWDNTGSTSKNFLTSTFDGTFSQTNIFGGTVSINNIAVIPQALLFASGFYTPNPNGSAGAVGPFYSSATNQTISVAINSSNGIVLSFSPGIPNGAIVTATSVYTSNSTKLYVISTLTNTSAATFYCQGMGDASFSTTAGFYFHITYGS